MCLVDPNKFWPGFTLTQSGFSKSCWVRFPQLHGTNMYMGLFPGHESLTKYVSCGSKQILTWVYFYSAWFLEICWCSFRSASRHQYMIRFPWPGPPLTSSSLSPPSKPKNWMRDLSEPNKFDLGLLLLSLVSQKLVGFISLSFTAPTCTEESFHSVLRAQPNMLVWVSRSSETTLMYVLVM